MINTDELQYFVKHYRRLKRLRWVTANALVLLMCASPYLLSVVWIWRFQRFPF